MNEMNRKLNMYRFNAASKRMHWHANPPNEKTGDYYNVTPDGKILG